MAKHKKKIRIEDNSKGAQLKNAQLKQKKATDNKNAYSKNRVIEFWTVMALIVFSIGGYAVYAGFHLYPEYEAVRNDNITLNTLAAWSVFLGIIYFLFSLSFFHLVAAKIKGHIKAPKTDYVVILIKLIVFFIWIYVSNDIYYDPNDSYDDVEKLISLGVIGGTIFVFDLVYFFVFTFVASSKSLAFSTRRKKHKNKNDENGTSTIVTTEITDNTQPISVNEDTPVDNTGNENKESVTGKENE